MLINTKLLLSKEEIGLMHIKHYHLLRTLIHKGFQGTLLAHSLLFQMP